MVSAPGDWPWSSYIAQITDMFAPPWLDTEWTLAHFGKQRKLTRRAFQRFVTEGKELASPLMATRHQLLLGDDKFVAQHRSDTRPAKLREMSIAHRRAVALTLSEYQKQCTNRNEVMSRAYKSGAYTMVQIADHFGVHYMTVSRAVRKFEL